MSDQHHHEHDIVIVGGGMAGASLAVGLARAGFNVAVIEAIARDAAAQPSYDDRTLVMNRASLNILAHLGIRDDSLAGRPIRRIEITRADSFGHVRLEAEPHGLDRFGEVIIARELGARLKQCTSDAGITEYCPEKVETLRIEDDRASVLLASGTRLTARLLVAADGTGSTIRLGAGIASTLHDYRQSAMIFNVLAEPGSTDIAHERFTGHGPLAFLPQPEGRYGAVLIDASDQIERMMQWDDNELLSLLERRSGAALGQFSNPGRRACYPLKLLRTEIPIGRRVVAIGNAANSVHPVSAQGLNLGLRDVAVLVEVLEDARDPGAPVWLARYLNMRKRDQADTVRYTDTLARVFSNPSLPFRVGTGIGLTAHALLPSLQRRLVHSAMGFRTPVPRLARDG